MLTQNKGNAEEKDSVQDIISLRLQQQRRSRRPGNPAAEQAALSSIFWITFSPYSH